MRLYNVVCCCFCFLSYGVVVNAAPANDSDSGSTPWLFFSLRESIHRLKPTSPVEEEVIVETTDSVGLDVDVDEQIIFWTSTFLEKIRSVTFDDSTGSLVVSLVTDVITTGVVSPEGVAVDWLYKHIYWTDGGMDSISVAIYDGSRRRTLIADGLKKPRGICLDPENGYMYWTDLGANPRIERSGMDGESRTVIVNEEDGIVWPNGLTIDYVAGRLYWVDAKLDCIKSTQLDGKGLRTVLTGNPQLMHPFGITVFEDDLYWTDWGNNSIRSGKKLTGENTRTVNSYWRMPNDIKVVHPQRQSKSFAQAAYTLCQEAMCQFMCLPAARIGNVSTVSCVCQDNDTLNVDGRTCIPPILTTTPPGSTPWLFLALRESIRRLKPSSPVEEEVIVETRDSVGLDVDVDEKIIFWTSTIFDKISSVTFNDTNGSLVVSNVTDVITTGVADPDGVAVDWLYKHFYWTDGEKKSISVASYDGSRRRTVIAGGLDEPRAICLDPQNGYMYWTDWGANPRIERSGMDGERRTVIVNKEDGIAWPNGLTIDYAAGRLYWVDAKLDCIKTVQLDGKGLRTVLGGKSQLSHPFGITVFEDDLYWTDWGNNTIRSLNRLTGQNVRTVYSYQRMILDIKVVHPQRQSISFAQAANTLCQEAMCQFMCLPAARIGNASTVSCVCQDNDTLNEDGRTCDPPINTTAPTAFAQAANTLCQEAMCQFMCLPAARIGNASTVSCVCQDNDTLNEDGRTCDPPLNTTTPTECKSSEFQCVSTSECIPESSHCDGSNDCADRSDEINCTTGSTPWLFVSLRESIRRLKPSSPVEEEVIVETTDSVALDVDVDKKNIFWTSALLDKISSVAFDDTNGSLVVTNVTDVITTGVLTPEGLAVDWLYEHFYWTDGDIDSISVASYDGSRRRTVIDDELDKPRAICVDPENGFMYWTDWGANPRIERSGMDGERRTVIVNKEDGIAWPNGLTIDYVAGRLYWVDAKLDCIKSIQLDGKGLRTVLAGYSQLRNPFGITVFEDDLYWTELRNHTIRSLNKLTGENIWTVNSYRRRVIDIKVVHPQRQSRSFAQAANTLCQEAMCQFMCLPAARIGNASTVSCVCQDNDTLNEDGRTCDPPINTTTPTECKSSEIHCVSTSECIPESSRCDGSNDCAYRSDEKNCTTGSTPWLFISLRESIRRLKPTSPFEEEVIVETTNSAGMDVDVDEKIIFWTSTIFDKISSVTFDDSNGSLVVSNVTDVITTGILTAEGLALDWLYKHLYWTDGYINSISVASYDGSRRRTVIDDELDQPRAICLDPENGYMYWTDWGANPRIERSGMDGERRTVIVNKKDGIAWPNGLTIDYDAGRLYWVDAKLDCIKSIQLDGKSLRTVLGGQSQLVHPYGITVFEDDLYWTDWRFKEIRSVNKLTGENVRTVHLYDRTLFDIKVFHPQRQSRSFALAAYTLCQEAMCQFMCLPAARIGNVSTVSCVCQDNDTLNVDGRTCDPPILTTTPPVRDGGWSSWGSWNTCSITCGSGSRSRVRQCDNPPHENGGLECQGPASVTEECHLPTCLFESPSLLYAGQRDIRLLNLKTLSDEVIIDGLTFGVALDYDIHQKKIIWSDISLKKIRSVTFNDSTGSLVVSNVTDVITTGIIYPEGLAVDWLYNHLYWTDASMASISVASYNGSRRRTVIADGLDEPRAICLDPENGYMFWTDWGAEAKIERSGMDGNNRTDLVTQADGILWPNGLTIDYISGRLYWLDGTLNKIGSVLLNGMDIRELPVDQSSFSHPISITLFQNRLYWANLGSVTIESVDRFTGKGVKTISVAAHVPMDLKIIHPSRQNGGVRHGERQLCQEANCQFMCLPSGNHQNLHKVSCFCKDGHQLNQDLHTCSPIPSKAPVALDGAWSPWGGLTACTVTCGQGSRSRVRYCNNPTPQNGGQDCKGSSIETEVCSLPSCFIIGQWSMWQNTSPCSVSCGRGSRRRTRRCLNPVKPNVPFYCLGEYKQTRPCIGRNC